MRPSRRKAEAVPQKLRHFLNKVFRGILFLSGALWSIRGRSIRRLAFDSEKLKHYADNPSELRILIAVSYFRVVGSERDQYLIEICQNAAKLDANWVEVAIFSNDSHGAQRALLNAGIQAHLAEEVQDSPVPKPSFSQGTVSSLPITIFQWKPKWPFVHPFYLPWAHKKRFKNALRADSGFTHFISLEDDIRFVNENLTYWLRHRVLLADSRKIPGFLCVERVNDHKLHAVPLTEPVNLAMPSGFAEPPEYVPVILPNPYQPMYVMDDLLANEHFFASPFSSRVRSRAIKFGIRERAQIGPIFSPLWPHRARNSVIFERNEKNWVLERGAMVLHLSGNYLADLTTPFGKLPVSEVIRGETVISDLIEL